MSALSHPLALLLVDFVPCTTAPCNPPMCALRSTVMPNPCSTPSLVWLSTVIAPSLEACTSWFANQEAKSAVVIFVDQSSTRQLWIRREVSQAMNRHVPNSTLQLTLPGRSDVPNLSTVEALEVHPYAAVRGTWTDNPVGPVAFASNPQ